MYSLRVYGLPHLFIDGMQKRGFEPFSHRTLLVLTYGHKKVSTAEAVCVGYMLLGLGDCGVCHAWLRCRAK